MTAIKQGDSYYLPVSITLDEERLDIETVECVEFYLNGRRKLWPDSVVYVQKTDTFHIHLTQEETFSWPPGRVYSAGYPAKIYKRRCNWLAKTA